MRAMALPTQRGRLCPACAAGHPARMAWPGAHSGRLGARRLERVRVIPALPLTVGADAYLDALSPDLDGVRSDKRVRRRRAGPLVLSRMAGRGRPARVPVPTHTPEPPAVPRPAGRRGDPHHDGRAERPYPLQRGGLRIHRHLSPYFPDSSSGSTHVRFLLESGTLDRGSRASPSLHTVARRDLERRRAQSELSAQAGVTPPASQESQRRPGGIVRTAWAAWVRSSRGGARSSAARLARRTSPRGGHRAEEGRRARRRAGSA